MSRAEQLHLLCWNCGLRFSLDDVFPCTDLGYPDCDQQLVPVDPPEKPPPHCGAWIFARELMEEGILAECCRCHEEARWASIEELKKGTCPNCGAQGYGGT